ncbi:MAG: STAS domain-containing protein [Oscillatoriaceae bacterium SKW80]|nr:STAS domain-containing protein [Oscillatoriaceae bacterium SKYG93]MCX8120118.1 STAS domain-containing protein [Oscillatoriaceae bacterium SKW80]MDW8453044.1 STAS domain-containing protein [Oscillatoriaceae cyanobacterium SKYGB_i_bin93]HIK29045.1 STAS domain-containing protein [Oscillatoriaceae cyanobacterium M7585_C2015_266]
MSFIVKVVQPSGILDRNKAFQFDQEINEIIASKADVVLIDFQNIEFMDSSGLGVLVNAIKTVKSARRKIVVCSLNNQVRMLFELAGVDRLLEIYTNREAVYNALSQAEISGV